MACAHTVMITGAQATVVRRCLRSISGWRRSVNTAVLIQLGLAGCAGVPFDMRVFLKRIDVNRMGWTS